MSLDFNFDGTNATTKGFITHNVNKDPLDRMERIYLELANYPGAIELSQKFPKRIIGVEGRLVGSSYTNLVTSIIPAFSSYLYKTSDKNLKFSDETDRYFSAKFDRFTRIQKYSAFRLMTLEFICAWPFAQAVTADSNTYTSKYKGYTWTETNSGHYYAYPIITITFNQTQSHIYISNNSITGCRFDISKSFVATDVLAINSKTLSVTLNSTYSPAGIASGGQSKAFYPLLEAGANTMEIGTDDGDLNVDINVWFRKEYLS